MPILEQDLRSALESHFPNADITLKDLAGDNDHWSATIVSTVFEGQSRVSQHRMVQAAVKEHDIHALQIITRTPNQG